MLRGYAGHVAFVNLSEGSIEEEELEERSYRDFLGGVGIGVKILYERMKAKVDPLGPDNLLGFMTGPFVGTPVPSAARYTVVAKSPLTGTWGDANAGGFFSSELKAAGYDGVFFSGISPEPVYLWLCDGKAELRGAMHLWGKDTFETQEILRQELGDKAVRVACIGPAGESMSLISAVINDKGRAAARSGLGAVMGAKRLKAIAVRGKRKVEVADLPRIESLRKKYLEEYRQIKSVSIRQYSTHGTCAHVSDLLTTGLTPVKNRTLFGEEAFPTHYKLDGDNVTKYQVRRDTCPGCNVGCGGIVTVQEGPFAVKEGRKPEYETLAAFGPATLVDDVEAVTKANDVCGRYGIDTISAGYAIAFGMECYERGVIGRGETGGIELKWGDAGAMVAMLEQMAKRQGFGVVLADGAPKAAERIGKNSEQWAPNFHGEVANSLDPRPAWAWGIGFLVDPTPGRHMPSASSNFLQSVGRFRNYPETQIAAVNRYDYKNRGVQYAIGSNWNLALNATEVCLLNAVYGPFPLPEFISAVTGWDFSAGEALTVGRRIQTLRQLFNTREGLSATDFRYPDRMKGPVLTGPHAGLTTDFDALRRGYYEAMGWDSETGKPSEQTLQELGLTYTSINRED